ncbi:MAG: formate dehydrogenase subunit alpha [Saprospiraceae bacterium]|nr:formate dehydrogenase subunit alpha [Candidatus Vicinibacter affinis]MBP6171926.1 formate dehydrogenase subunit alpha [Saprospiraceae bacterium]MBK6573094.1 formate dehydrogenase subunit alpha [Candidatus Vicinibacter affinis]MBK6822443.1 formate dehydrogenase subunit alpha [Candidatus Vicinibacter affinis]MBK7797717.1 formate dehydrogenase subunit alpha [Candidatus Vicinibacter affinis]
MKIASLLTEFQSIEIKTKTAEINGKPYSIADGETVLSFIRRHLGKNYVPTLCDAPNLEAFGSCRVCSVEVGRPGNGGLRTVASCHTPVEENMIIITESESIQKLRKNIIELVLTDHPLDCLTCEVNGNCELQDTAARVGIRKVRYPEGKNHLDRQKDLSHPYMTSDLSKCIMCYRCVRACDEVQGQLVLSVMGRGFDSQIIKGKNESFFDSDCVSCGACAQACPTSAISDVFQSKALVGQDKIRTICTYCGVGCNLEVSVKNGEILSIQAPYNAEVNSGHTCLKGRYAFKFYKHPERLQFPMIRKNGILERVSWEEAYDFIAKKLNEVKSKYGPDAIGGISSARCTNEENYLMQKFIRAVIGTNNIDGCARVCHSPTALGMQRTFGTGAATNSIEDLKYTNAIMVIGANPTDGHPVTGSKLRQHALKGKTTIVIDPRRTEIARLATHHLQLRPGTNVAVLNMMLYYIIKEGLVAKDFIDTRTEGFEDFKENILNLNLDELETVSGVPREQAREAAIAYASAGNAMSFHGLGVTEHYQGTYTVMLIADLAMITGNIGRRGVGVNPLRGQNNVQGMADMGVQPYQGAGYLDLTQPEIREKYSKFYGAEMPQEIGLKIPEMYNAAIAGDFKALWVMGEDMAQSDPNTHKVIKALESLELLVVQELFMTETAKYAHVVLPGASFLEKEGTFTNGERRIQRVNQVVKPIGEAKVDGQIVVDIMNRMGYSQPDYSAKNLLEEICQIVPFFAGVKWDELGVNGKQWPVLPDGSDTKILHKDEFKRGKGKFVFKGYVESPEILNHADEFPFILTTNRVLEHYNAGTMTRRTGNANIITEDILMVNPNDAKRLNILEEDMVYLESARGNVTIKAHITDEVKPGILSTTFHFPELMLNVVTSDVSDEIAMCPEYKVVSCRIKKL